MAGPLAGVRIIEFSGIGPAPFCGMLLSDLGAEIVRIERPGIVSRETPVTLRNRRVVELDLQDENDRERARELVDRADVLIEGFRPGVMERLGLGPDMCLERNPKLVFGRITGWGQSGPLAQVPGHDINYIALTGALHAIGEAGRAPVPPLNLVGDYGGGAMLLAVGVLSALLESRYSGKGQVVDAAMTDGVALLSSLFFGLTAAQRWTTDRGNNILDGGAFFYGTYACADDRYVAVGAIEPQFYTDLRKRCGLSDPVFDNPSDSRSWPQAKRKLAEIFRTKTRDEWCTLMEGSDACFAPVLDWEEAPAHPHNIARSTFIAVDGITQPAPAPRFSRTQSTTPVPPRAVAVADVLEEWQRDERALGQDGADRPRTGQATRS